MGGKRERGGGRGHWSLLLALALVCAAPAVAQTPAAETRAVEPETSDTPQGKDSPQGKEALRGIETEIEKSGFEQRRLSFEIDTLSTEAQQLRAALIEVARRVREAEERLAAQEAQLDTLTRQQAGLRRSLQARERVTAEVLAAMQRIGRKPPPALLVAPEDVLSAMRAALLLGAVLPDMRDEAMILIADLRTLTELHRQSATLTDQLRRQRDEIGAERARMAGLVETRQSQITLSKEQLDKERARVSALTKDARSLRDLIARSEGDIIGNARAVEIARRAPAPVRGGTSVAALRPEATREPARLQPRQSFVERRGQMAMPVSGTILKPFGQPDGLGGTERGITIASLAGAVVTAPADGWVNFAGSYRGYGQLVIFNAGNGYHVVLAGMARISVEIGQFVLAGEPIGFLAAGGEAVASTEAGQTPATGPKSENAAVLRAQAAGNSQQGLGAPRPALYVEFRKDGSPVDPSPWLSHHSAEKARG
jgi:murein hydrolase activator